MIYLPSGDLTVAPLRPSTTIDYYLSAKVLIHIGARLIKSSISESKFECVSICVE